MYRSAAKAKAMSLAKSACEKVMKEPKVQEEIKKQLMEMVKKDPAAALKMAQKLLAAKK